MRRIVLITALAFCAGLFTVGLSLGAGEYGHEMDSKGEGSMMDESKGMMEKSQDSMMEKSGQSKMAVHDLDSSQVRKMQDILKDKGFDPGLADGILGPHTEQALSSFQESEGLAVTGKPDKETLHSLAPDAETQEFFGLSPEFGEQEMMQEGEKEMMRDMEHKQPQEDMEMPSESESRKHSY